MNIILILKESIALVVVSIISGSLFGVIVFFGFKKTNSIFKLKSPETKVLVLFGFILAGSLTGLGLSLKSAISSAYDSAMLSITPNIRSIFVTAGVNPDSIPTEEIKNSIELFINESNEIIETSAIAFPELRYFTTIFNSADTILSKLPVMRQKTATLNDFIHDFKKIALQYIYILTNILLICSIIIAIGPIIIATLIDKSEEKEKSEKEVAKNNGHILL